MHRTLVFFLTSGLRQPFPAKKRQKGMKIVMFVPWAGGDCQVSLPGNQVIQTKYPLKFHDPLAQRPEVSL